MYSLTKPKRYSAAFFSLDAAAWLSVAILVFASFALLLSSAGKSAGSQASETSSSLLALRFSSYLLDEAACAGSGIGRGAYCSANEIDLQRLSSIDMQDLLERTGRGFIGVYLEDSEGAIFLAEQGQAAEGVFCTSRLALVSGKMARMRACVS